MPDIHKPTSKLTSTVSGEREAFPAGRELHGDERAVQLLLHVRDVAKDSGEAARKEGRKELWTAWKQETGLFLRYMF